jgi:hypothetical protein
MVKALRVAESLSRTIRSATTSKKSQQSSRVGGWPIIGLLSELVWAAGVEPAQATMIAWMCAWQ